jgi:hypothetical protein
MPAIPLDAVDAFELAELLQFLSLSFNLRVRAWL